MEPEQPQSQKHEILSMVRLALLDGTINPEDLRALLPAASPSLAVIQPSADLPPLTGQTPTQPIESGRKKLTAVEVMFYIAGIVLYGAIMTFIGQSWDSGPNLTHVGISAGVGILLWILAAVFSRQPTSSDIIKGLENSLILTGSLSIITGGFIALSVIMGDATEHMLIPIAITCAILGAVHFLYDRIVKKDLILLLAIFTSVGTVPTALSGIIEPLGAKFDAYALVSIGSVLFLVYATHILSKIMPERPILKHPFDGLAAFVSLLTMFIGSFTPTAILWLVALIVSVFGLFYLSIIRRSKDLLGNASLFLIVAILTITFKYFTGFGAAFSLIIAAMGLLGSGAVAATINKKYFKTPTPEPVQNQS